MTVEEFAIPKDRVAVVIGPNGGTRKTIEKETQARVKIDSKNGDVEIEAEDAVQVLKSANIVRAIGRGFSPEHAMRLADDEYCLEIINLTEFWENTTRRFSQRNHWKKGAICPQIEKDTQTFISVYGKQSPSLGKLIM